jgi:L-rhamnose-H+ transport protein
MWGVGAVTFGLCVRYLGISLGMTVVVGLCAAFGTLIPPVVDGQFGQLLVTLPGLTILCGVFLCLLGIVFCGWAGTCKENELTEQQKQESIKEFALVKGFVMATVSGVMSAGMAYAIHAGRPIAQVAIAEGAPDTYQNNPVFVVALAGGFAVNAVFCLVLSIRNRSTPEYVMGPGILLLTNYLLVALAGILWYSQLLFLGMGTTTMGEYAFAAWSILTALMMVTSMCWGLVLKEWKGVSSRTLLLVWSGIALLVLSVMVIGAGSHLGTAGS